MESLKKKLISSESRKYVCLLSHEMLSMKEVGDGLHEQMNCMMGALQELKLLQVQTALEQLEISETRNKVSGIGQHQCCRNGREIRLSSALTMAEYCPPRKFDSASLGTTGNQIHRDIASIPQTLAGSRLGCRECQASDEANDWTSSLMSQSRNRQPLVLGDNIFADLVGNWLDLPELDKKGEKNETSLSISRSQEFYRKFSLTANIFKKFLRSVRPDRDRLLKEKPCWLLAEDRETEISKRSKKVSKQKGTFYFPLYGNLQNVHGTTDHTQSGFDMNTAVWV
uniref:PAK4-inhibitor INKA2 n=1 Tax=Chelonoidis abingdonii TaxID=106734 RepID=A0A8C0GNM9_CHEAB